MKITPDRLAALVVALAPLAYFYPATLGRLFLTPDDGVIFNVPVRVAAARMLAAGSLPLWNPYVFSGVPLLASAQPGVLFPLNWFFLVFDAPLAANLMMLSTYAAAGLGAYLYARRGGANVAGALLTGLVWQTCGFMVAQVGHANVVQTSALLPWLLWALDGCAATGRRRSGTLLAALVALQVFAGHSQTNAYSLLLVAAYALASAYNAREDEERRSYLRSLAYVAAGIALAAVQILPTLELLRASLRADASYEFFSSFSMPPRFALAFLAPYLTGGGQGALFRAPYTGVAFYAEYIGYVGLAPLALAALAPLIARDARTKFWAAVALVAFALALGRFLPADLYAVVYRIPVLNLFRVPARHLMEVDFALAVLAGRALAALSAARGRRESQREGRFSLARGLQGATARAALVCAPVAVLTLLAVTAWRPSEFRLGRMGPVSFLRAPELFMPVVVAALSAWAVWNFARGRGRGATPLLFAVVLFDLCLWGHSSGWRRAPGREHELWRAPDVVRILREREPRGEGSFRVLTVPQQFSPEESLVAPAPEGEFVLALQPNTYMMHGVENAAGYDGFGLERYSRLAGDMKVWGELAAPHKTLLGAGRELDILNVRYLLARNPRFNFEGQQPTPTTSTPAPTPSPTPPPTVLLGGRAFAEETLRESQLSAGERLAFETPDVEADALALVTNLSWAAEVSDGETVARVRLRAEDGREFAFDLRAGEHTSEWAYDRADTRARVRHARAPVATSFRVGDPAGDFEGHTYVASFSLPRRAKITGGEIETARVAHAPKLIVSVERVSLADGALVNALRREQVRKISAAAGGEAAHATSERWRHVADEGPLVVYENTRALPRAWLATEAFVVADDAALQTIRTGLLPDGRAWEPRSTVLTASALGNELTGGGGGDEARRAEVTSHEANRVEVLTEASAPSVLVLADNHYPGWRAYVDGRGVETVRANYNLRGVLLPAGRHQVTFVYRPKSALLGLLVSLLSAFALAAWCARVSLLRKPKSEI